MYKCKYFTIQELVPPETYEVYGERLWYYFDQNVLKAMDMLRQYFGPCTVNNWSYNHTGETFRYRGYRPYTYSGGSPLSAHRCFKAADSHFKNAHPQEVRDYPIESNGLAGIVKRIEDDVNWVHIDTIDFGSDELIVFKP